MLPRPGSDSLGYSKITTELRRVPGRPHATASSARVDGRVRAAHPARRGVGMSRHVRRWVATALTTVAMVAGSTAPSVADAQCSDTPRRGGLVQACRVAVNVGAAELDATWHPGQDAVRPVLESNAQRRVSEGFRTAGVHTKPTVKAVVVGDGTERFALVRIDTLIITRTLYAAAVARVQRSTGIPGERLLLSATHTHSAGSGIPPDVEQQFLAERVADAVAAALADARPAALAVARSDLVLPGWNRAGDRLYTPEGATEPKARTDAARLDPQLGVLAFSDVRTREPIAVLVNYAVHPVVLVDQQPLISTDFVTQLERRVQQASSTRRATPVAMWMTGAAGDVDPVYIRRSYRHAEWTGAALADAVTTLLDRTRPEPMTRAAMADKVVPLPEPGAPPPDPARPPVPGGPSSARIQAVELSSENVSTALLSWPGEPHSRLGVDLRKAAVGLGFDHAMVLSLANEWAGYFRTAREHDDGTAGSALIFYGRNTASYLQGHLLDLADHLRAGTALEPVALPAHAVAERAALATAAEAVADRDVAALVTPPPGRDADPQLTSQPASTVRLGVVTTTWLGGSPHVASDWVPRVSVQRRHAQRFETVAREGTGDILLSVVRTPAGYEWTAQWQTLPDTHVGNYRIHIEGQRQEGLASAAYALVSDEFTVSRCQCLKAGALTAEPAGAGVEISLGVSYPPAAPGEFRLLPGAVTPSQRLVTTGQVLVEVVRGGQVIDVLALPFHSRVRPVADEETYNGAHAMPTETGRFQAVWTGARDVEFRVADVDDGHGNRQG